MATIKKALISPAIDAQQAMPSQQDEQQLFEEKFGQMAYQAFSAKFPDLIAEIVTFKILDSDIDAGTAVGAFILEQEGSYVYVPAVISDNELKPFDMMYVKDRDIFVPLDNKWLDEVNKGTLSSLGEGSKLPSTVATDVDIRNIVVPPTTGRYSYASLVVSPRTRMEAEASQPLGRKLTKLAIGAFPGSTGESSGPVDFNPELWAAFVEQFQRTQQMTPGQALDSSIIDVDTLGKMYKSHLKTWEMMSNGSANAQAPQAMAAPSAMQSVSPVTASVKQGDASSYVPRTIGKKLDSLIHNAVRSGGVGALTAAITRDADNPYSKDLPTALLHGAAGGALLGPIGSLIGEDIAAHAPNMHPGLADSLGRYSGAALGGYVASQPARLDEYGNPRTNTGLLSSIAGMARLGSDHSEDLKALLKHAQKVSKHVPQLPRYLRDSPKKVKVAFTKVLSDNPQLLKKAVDIYGEDVLLEALSSTKTAGLSSVKSGLSIANADTKPEKYTEFFGEAAPEAFNGVLMRGYYFKDTRPALKLAVQVQTPKDVQNAMDSGVYRLYSTEGTPKAALVITEPYDLHKDDRYTFPKDDSRVKRIRNKVPADGHVKEPYDLEPFDKDKPTNPDIARSHIYTRLAVLENGDYIVTTKLFGEQVSESYLKGSPLYKALLTDGKSEPSKGMGVFLLKHGTNYRGTRPVDITEISTGSDGVIRGTLDGGKRFVIDPRSPGKRPIKLQDQNLVVIPASWKWVSLNKSLDAEDFIRTPAAISELVMNSLGSMGIHEAVVRSAGQSQYAIQGQRTTTKAAALRALAETYYIHASAAEAMLKVAELTGSCRAYIVSPREYVALNDRIKIAQGELPPQTAMGGPPAMQLQSAPGMATGPAPAAPGMPPAMMQEPMEPAAPPPPSPVDQAFGESMQSLQSQMNELQAQLSVLTTVQQRAQEIALGQAEGPDMQGVPEGMDPSMGMDPNAPADPNMQQEQPPMPIMRTEEPSANEIASQINPAFLENAANLHETGAFDAGSIASLANNANLASSSSQYAAGLEDSVDDLGRTLLTLYMQESELKDRLGDDTFVKLETQLRDTFKGLGALVLSLTHNTAMLNTDAAA